MGKEVMNLSAEGGSIDTALALERNAIQWIVYAPDNQAMLEVYRREPEALTKVQKNKNIESDINK